MANSSTPSRGAAPSEDSKNFPPRDRDQHAVSAARAESKAEQAEAAATRPIGGANSDRAEPLPGRDHLQGSADRAGGDGPTGGPGDGGGERRQRISERAYQRAEQRGFAPGGEDGDWFEAEKEIDGPAK